MVGECIVEDVGCGLNGGVDMTPFDAKPADVNTGSSLAFARQFLISVVHSQQYRKSQALLSRNNCLYFPTSASKSIKLSSCIVVKGNDNTSISHTSTSRKTTPFATMGNHDLHTSRLPAPTSIFLPTFFL